MIKKPWSCLYDSFEHATGFSFVDLIGHDGSEIIFPEIKEPYSRRTITIDEITHALYKLGIYVVHLGCDNVIMYEHPTGRTEFTHLGKFEYTLRPSSYGQVYVDNVHAVAINSRGEFYDPAGKIDTIGMFTPAAIYALHS